MSINWVMIDQKQGFVRLPGEKLIWHSSSRTSLDITTPRAFPGHSPLAIRSSSGIIYLTNQRVVYLPTTPTQEFRSFSAPLTNLHDSHVTVPWFGPNVWQAIIQPVPGGNIPPEHTAVELKFTFKEGGATDFHSNFERIKEKFQQVLESSSTEGGLPIRRDGGTTGMNMDAVHLDQLPTYEASNHDRTALPTEAHQTTLSRPEAASLQPRPALAASRPPAAEPSDAPPGYEETQQQSVQEEVDRRLSGGCDDGGAVLEAASLR